ncbi:hypothetical protein P615_11180 [Brevibacillus laterosporus PE36]|nr:hypothetical protein P615_11180 [Brevibacillus laterosporus PE36]
MSNAERITFLLLSIPAKTFGIENASSTNFLYLLNFFKRKIDGQEAYVEWKRSRSIEKTTHKPQSFFLLLEKWFFLY